MEVIFIENYITYKYEIQHYVTFKPSFVLLLLNHWNAKFIILAVWI